MLINGSPTKEFSPHRGLFQDDPLSPFLFILSMEGLHVVLEDVVSQGLFHGEVIENGVFVLSHIFYVGDDLFLGEWVE